MVHYLEAQFLNIIMHFGNAAGIANVKLVATAMFITGTVAAHIHLTPADTLVAQIFMTALRNSLLSRLDTVICACGTNKR